jgi:hypothetical protein
LLHAVQTKIYSSTKYTTKRSNLRARTVQHETPNSLTSPAGQPPSVRRRRARANNVRRGLLSHATDQTHQILYLPQQERPEGGGFLGISSRGGDSVAGTDVSWPNLPCFTKPARIRARRSLGFLD